MSTIPEFPASPKDTPHVLLPFWCVSVYVRAHHTNGDTYYMRASNRAMAITRAVALLPGDFEFERLNVEAAPWYYGPEIGFGLDNE